MPKLEGGEGFIDKVIKPRRLKILALKRLRYPRRIQLLNLGLMSRNGLIKASAIVDFTSGETSSMKAHSVSNEAGGSPALMD